MSDQKKHRQLENTISHLITYFMGFFMVAQMVKNLSAMPETWVQSLGWEDPLEKGMATHSNIILWRIPQTKEPVGLQWAPVHGVAKSQTKLSDYPLLEDFEIVSLIRTSIIS